jgi:hypothetical protein
MSRKFNPPVRATEEGFLVDLSDHERQLLTEDDHPYLDRLFPTAYPDDDEAESEYQRLMREELVTSRTMSIDRVTELLDRPPEQPLDEGETLAFLQSVNAMRLVLGTMLGISDDEDAERVDAGDGSEQQLYGYLSWLLEWTVQALSGR